MSRAQSALIPSAFVVFLHVRVSYFSGITELNDSMCFDTASFLCVLMYL